MATVTLRPDGDIYMDSDARYSSGSSAYVLVNEASADDNGTYVYTKETTSELFVPMIFRFTHNFGQNVKLNSITAVYRGAAANSNTVAYVKSYDSSSTKAPQSYSLIIANGKSFQAKLYNDSTQDSFGTSYSTVTRQGTAISSWTSGSSSLSNEELSSLEIRALLIPRTSASSSKGDNPSFRLTQFYIILDYTPVTTTHTLTVTYNGSTIINEQKSGDVSYSYGSTSGTISSGQTKTMKCNGKVCSSNIVIGGKTLKCNGKIMATDIVITLT